MPKPLFNARAVHALAEEPPRGVAVVAHERGEHAHEVDVLLRAELDADPRVQEADRRVASRRAATRMLPGCRSPCNKLSWKIILR